MRKASAEYPGYFEYTPVNYKGEQVAESAMSYEDAEENAYNGGYDRIDTWQAVLIKKPFAVI